LGAAGRAALVAAATNPAQPAVAEEALLLLGHLTADSDVRKAELWTTLGAAGRAAVAAAATNPAQPAVAEEALRLLVNLADNSDPTVAEQSLRLLADLTASSKDIAADLWATLRNAELADVVHAATYSAQPAVAEQALRLLANLTASSSSDYIAEKLWATLRNAGRADVVHAATYSAQPAVAEQALRLLRNLTANSDVRKAKLWAALRAAGRADILTAATNPAKPRVAEQALGLLVHLTANSDARKDELWATLRNAWRVNEVAAATNPAQPAVAKQALRLLANLTSSSSSDYIAEKLWATLEAAERAAIVTAATNPAQPAVAKQALRLLANLAVISDYRANIWAALRATGRAAVVTAATNPAQPTVAKQALRLLVDLTAEGYDDRVRSYNDRANQLWATLGAAERAALVAAVTNPAQPRVAEQALGLLVHLTANSDARKADLWATLGATGRAALVAAVTNPAEPRVAENARYLLGHLTANSDARKADLWATLGATGRAALVAAATSLAQPAVAKQALSLLSHLTANSNVIKAELWATLGAAGREGLIIAATTAGEPEVASMAIVQPRLAQLWEVTTQPSVVKQTATNFLFAQIRGNAQRTRQALNVLNAAAPAIFMRHTIATLREWGKRVGHHEPERLALLTGIVQANTSSQKMAVFIAAVMSGINLRQRPQGEREALRDQVLAIPMEEGINPTPYRQRMRLVFDAATTNTSAVLESPVLSASEKLQLLEILYIFEPYLNPLEVHEELSKVRLRPNTSRDFKVKAIGLLLNHGQASSTQFKEILAWLKGEFATDTHTVFTNPDTLGNITDEEIYALAEQRQQYLSLYQNFGSHMTRDFIQAEIARINQQVMTKEIPEDFAATLIFQLRQFLSTAAIGTTVKDHGRYDSKSESK
jgi:sugar diacid utilization regulator